MKIGPKIVTDDLVLYLDAANKKSYPKSGDTWTNLVDSNYATLINSPAFDSSNGGSLYFRGPFDDDYGIVPSLNLTSTDFSICGWMYLINTGNYRAFMGYSGLRRILISTSGYVLQQFAGNYFTTGVIPDNIWTYYTYTYNSAGLLSKTYINGVYDSQYIGTNSWNSAFYLGRYSSVTFYRLHGNLANIKIYNKELLQPEVTQNFNAMKNKFI